MAAWCLVLEIEKCCRMEDVMTENHRNTMLLRVRGVGLEVFVVLS